MWRRIKTPVTPRTMANDKGRSRTESPMPIRAAMGNTTMSRQRETVHPGMQSTKTPNESAAPSGKIMLVLWTTPAIASMGATTRNGRNQRQGCSAENDGGTCWLRQRRKFPIGWESHWPSEGSSREG